MQPIGWPRSAPPLAGVSWEMYGFHPLRPSGSLIGVAFMPCRGLRSKDASTLSPLSLVLQIWPKNPQFVAHHSVAHHRTSGMLLSNIRLERYSNGNREIEAQIEQGAEALAPNTGLHSATKHLGQCLARKRGFLTMRFAVQH